MNDIEKVLVIGASGKTGSLVYKGLQEHLPKDKVKAASRNSSTVFDWHDDSTWRPALQGISHVYLTYYPDLAVEASASHISEFCQLASSMRVKHVTLLSGRGEPAAQQCETILIDSGLSWNVVRASWFNQNFSDGFFKGFIDAGNISLPVKQVKEPFIDVGDIADVVVETLINPSKRNQLFEVTGPELLSFEDLAMKFSKSLGREVKFNIISQSEFNTMMLAQQVPEDVLALLNFLFTEVLDGRNEYLTNGVKSAIGRSPISFSEYISNNLARF
ncbi:MAG: NmrA family NAD(P)-binding protein [Paraglaciecola sp.]|uniref:NmrA family NAD(P)-binding protein n=1 Tax=Paraglaciecola sp. TaxID=1920173 RepID=UPI0032971722